MFILKYFKESIKPKNILGLRKEKFYKVLAYFLLMVLVSLFPVNMYIMLEGGWNLGFMYQELSDETIIVPNVNFPDIKMNHQGLSGDDNEIIIYFNTFSLIVNGKQDKYDVEGKYVVLQESRIIYSFDNDISPIITTYSHLNDLEFRFENLNSAQTNNERVNLYLELADMIENSFTQLNIIGGIFMHSGAQLLSFIILIPTLGLLVMLFKFRSTNFMSYLESVKTTIFSMTIPAVASFVIGFIAFSFSTVIMQFGIGIVLMIVMLKYGKKEFSS